MRVTIKDVARLAGVSVSTASMALNNKKGISEETRMAVMEAAKSLNYRPNKNAQSLKMDRTSTVGLVVPEIINPFFSAIVESVREEVESCGYTLLLGISGQQIGKEHKYVDEFISRNVDGIIIVPIIGIPQDLSHLYSLRSMGVPFVFLTTKYDGILADCVMTDLYKGEYLVTKHLLQTGHRKIFIIAADRKLELSSMRINGYISAFREMGVEYKEEWIYETVPDFKHGFEAARDIVVKKPDAIITINDILALGVLKFLKEASIKVPEEISVAGYDDLLYASLAETPLTTVRQPIEDMCAKAVELLVNRIEKVPMEFETHYYEPELKIRNSTR